MYYLRKATEHQIQAIVDRAAANGLDTSIFTAKTGYTNDQLKAIYWGLVRGYDVSAYADPAFGTAQMIQIYYGLKHGVDVSLYAKPEFLADQMEMIRDGLEHGLDVSLYANPAYTGMQMYEIRAALISGLDVREMLNPEFSPIKMQDLRKRLHARQKGYCLSEPEGSVFDPVRLYVPFPDLDEKGLIPDWQ